MRPVVPYNKFFTADAYVENLETGNVFWAYHVANNFGRILGVDGTLYFPAMGDSVETPRMAEVSLRRLGLNSVPIVQHYSRTGELYEVGTAFFDDPIYGEVFGSVIGTIGEHLASFWTIVNGRSTPPYHPAGITIRFRDAAELIHVVGPGFGVPTGQPNQWLMPWVTVRGHYNTTPLTYYEGSVIDWMPDSAISTSVNTTQNYWQHNSPHVQCTIADGHLKFRWMHDSSGTVYFKLFGGG